jgi:drug/metabolite transporter (DMT)-like permease
LLDIRQPIQLMATTSAGILPAAPRQDAARGILLMLAAVAVFSTMDALIKYLTAGYSPIQIIFFRNLFAFLPIFPLLARGGGIALLRTRRLGSHIARAAMGFGAMICFFTAFALMPLAEVVAISLSAPIFITAFSVPLLAEQVGPRSWAAVLVGFIGVLVMVRPGGAALNDPVAFLPLAGAVLYALALIAMRKLGATERAPTTVFYFTLACTVLSGLAQPFVWKTPDLPDLALLICVGLLGGSAQLLMTQALRIAPAAVVAPFDYTALVFSIGYGFAFWGEVPDLLLLVGAAIVVASGLYILHRETLRKHQGKACHEQT